MSVKIKEWRKKQAYVTCLECDFTERYSGDEVEMIKVDLLTKKHVKDTGHDVLVKTTQVNRYYLDPDE